jgi:hypothetical protein
MGRQRRRARRLIRHPLGGLCVLGVCWLLMPAPAQAGVYLNVPLAQPERPTNLPDDGLTVPVPHDPSKFLDVQSFVNHITWTSWGEATATGTGIVEVESSDTRPGQQQPYVSQTAPVAITASGLTVCGGQLLYTTYDLTLTGSAPAPRDFAYAANRALPCHLQALDYYAGYEKVANTTGDCLFRGVSTVLPHGFGYFGYCHMHWQGWGQQLTTGTGIGRAVALPRGCDGRHSECDYGIRVTLSRPAWCPAYGMSYTRERLEVFGHGVVSNTSLIALTETHHLLATIGRPPRQVVFQQVERSQHCQSPPSAHTASTLPLAFLNQPRLSEAMRPAAISFGEPRSPTVPAVSLSGVQWATWGEATASGTGQALIEWASAGHQEIAHLSVDVTASGLSRCGGLNVYTSLGIDLAPGAVAPPDFSQVQRDHAVQPCQVHAGRYVAGTVERSDPQGCFFTGLSERLLFRSVGHYPYGINYCAMHWTSWGSSQAVGVGVARKADQQWGLRVVLTRPAWCPSWTISYTQETAELWGVGEQQGAGGNVSPHDTKQLDSLIGRPGQPHWTAHEAMPAQARCGG